MTTLQSAKYMNTHFFSDIEHCRSNISSKEWTRPTSMPEEDSPSYTHKEEEEEEDGNEMEEMLTSVGVGRWQIPLFLSACLGMLNTRRQIQISIHTP